MEAKIPEITGRKLRSAFMYRVEVKTSKRYPNINNINKLLFGLAPAAVLVNALGRRLADVYNVGLGACIVYGPGAVGNCYPMGHTCDEYAEAAAEFVAEYGEDADGLHALRLGFVSDCVNGYFYKYKTQETPVDIGNPFTGFDKVDNGNQFNYY